MVSLRVLVDDRQIGKHEERVFEKTPVRIGRNALNDLPLKSKFVSQWHSVVQFTPAAIEYLDLGSTNGTFLNGKRVTARAPIIVRENDELAIGNIHLSLRCEARQRAAANEELPTGTTIDPSATAAARLAISAAEKVSPAYEAYRAAWHEFHELMQTVVGGTPPHIQAEALKVLQARFPEIANEREFVSFKGSLGLPDESSAPAIASPAELANQLSLPGSSVRDGGELLRRVADVLDAFCSSFVELRSGLDQFGSDVAVRTFRDRTPLHHAEAGREVLHYLLSRDAAGSSRVRDLKSAFADMMIHQIAMISGVMDGVRGLLKRVSPGAVEANLALHPVKMGPFRVKRGFWPFSVVARWRRYAQLHQELMEDDQEVSSVLFGKEFARSYGAAHGEHAEPGAKVR